MDLEYAFLSSSENFSEFIITRDEPFLTLSDRHYSNFIFTNYHISKISFTNTIFENCQFINCHVKADCFSHSIISGCEFIDCNIDGKIASAQLDHVVFLRANINSFELTKGRGTSLCLKNSTGLNLLLDWQGDKLEIDGGKYDQLTVKPINNSLVSFARTKVELLDLEIGSRGEFRASHETKIQTANLNCSINGQLSLDRVELKFVEICNLGSYVIKNVYFLGCTLSGFRLAEVLSPTVTFEDLRLRSIANVSDLSFTSSLWGEPKLNGAKPASDVNEIKGLPLVVKRKISDYQYVQQIWQSSSIMGQVVLRLWGITSAFGQSFIRMLLFMLLVTLITIFTIYFIPHFEVQSDLNQNDRLNSWCFNQDHFLLPEMRVIIREGVMLMLTSETSLIPTTWLAEIILIIIRFMSYVVLASFVSVLAVRFARLS